MSVYKPAKSRLWHYDFQLKGVRFHGSTGQTSRRAAEAVERQRRLEAATGSMGEVGQMTLDAACGRYWEEVGIHRGDAEDVERRLTALIRLLKPHTILAHINQAVVAKAVQDRKKIGRKRGKAADAKVYLPSNSTVNRDVIETLRPVLKRAKTHWTPKGAAHGLPEIDWRELRLPEPRGLSRSYSAAEQAAWIEAGEAEDVGLAVEMILTYGLRLGELLFGLDQLGGDLSRPTLMLQKGRKRDVLLEVALTREHGRLLFARATRARSADLDTVWFVQAGLNPDGTERLEPMTYAMLEYRLSKAADAAGIKGGRRIHGARHHAAGAILRDTKNLMAVKGLLGHASIQSSQRYTHVLNDELRDAIEGRTKRDDRSGTIPGEFGRLGPDGPEMFRTADGAETPEKARKA